MKFVLPTFVEEKLQFFFPVDILPLSPQPELLSSLWALLESEPFQGSDGVYVRENAVGIRAAKKQYGVVAHSFLASTPLSSQPESHH